MALRIGELVGVLRADASAWERGLDRAQVRLAGLQRDTAGRLRDMNGRFVRAGGDSGRGFGRTMLSAIGSTLRQGFSAAMETGMQGLRGLSSAISSNPYVAAAGMALAAGIVVTMLPAIGALLAASVISVAGLGVIGVAAMVLKEKPAVQKAAKSLKTTIMDGLKEAAAPLEDEFVTAMKSVEQTFKDIQPALEKIFKSVQPLIKPLTDGFDKLVKNLLPGFTDMMENAGPVFEAFEEVMADVGEGLSGFFREIGKASPEAGQVLKDIGEVLKEVLIWGGKFIAFLARLYDKVRPVLDFIWDVCRGINDAFVWLFDVLVGNSVIPDMINAIVDWFLGLPGKIIGKLGEFVTKVKDKFVQMKDKAVKKAKDMVNGAVHWISRLPGRAWNALRDLGAKIAARAWDAGRRLVGAIRNKVGDAVRFVRGLPGRAIRALAGIGSRLYNSGRALIGGFIRGIWSRIGEVANAAWSVVQRARNFFPFSPAKEGPFSGKGWTLYSGRALIDGFRAGITQQLPALRRDLGGLPGVGTPAFGAPGLAGAGPSRGQQAVVVRFDVTGSNEEMKALIRKIVHVDGRGDVQYAFGDRRRK